MEGVLSITESEVLEALRRAFGEQPDGFSSIEFAEALGISVECARDKMRKLYRAGSLKCTGRRSVQAIDGRRTTVPVYKIG